MKPLAAALWLFPLWAAAQAPSFEVDHLQLDPAARGSLLVGNGQTLPAGTFRVSAALQVSEAQLQSKTGAITTTFLRDRLAVHVLGAVGITSWLELGAELPVVVHQTSETSLFTPSPSGLGTPFVQVKIAILDRTRALAVWGALGVGLPVGTPGALGNGGWALTPRLNAGRNFDHVQLGAEVGALIRPLVSLVGLTGNPDDELGTQLYLAGTVTSVGDGLRGELSVRTFVSLTRGPPGVEGLVGLRVPFAGTELFVVVGPGFAGAPATPSFRLYLGAAFGDAGPPRARCDPNTEYELADCPDLDQDGDGVKNGVDLAPLEPEDKDGFEDEDGKPDPDNDQDGVPDGLDHCPNVAGPKENAGCPDTDSDGDGIVDRLDKCPTTPEDHDGFQDEDGCPDPDNDGDGLPDVRDACPDEPGIPEEKGCPPRDDDHDGTPNHLDNCKNFPGPPENQGCPVAEKQLVVVTKERLEILDKVFFEPAKATIQKRSFLLLDQLAAVLTERDYLQVVQIEGHTDEAGRPEANLKLSTDRANAVRDYLVQKGIAPERLKAVGFGQQRPLAPNTTAAGRELNRRVEFNILQQE